MEFSGFVGVRKETMKRALDVMGWKTAIQSLDHLAQKLDQIDRPDAYLATLVENARKGLRVLSGSGRNRVGQVYPGKPGVV